MLRALLLAVLVASGALAWRFVRSVSATEGDSTPVAMAYAAETPDDALEALFLAADRSADGLPDLIVGVSARIAAATAGEGDALALRLEPYCRRAFFGPERFAGMERLGIAVHTVGKGEVPGAIARRYGFSDGLLGRLNQGYAPRSLRVGQELKVLDLRSAGLRLVVDRERHRLAALRGDPAGGGELVMLYVTVGLGAPATPTPSGTTRVVERALDCEWTDPNTGVTYPPGDPGNLLGGYWMRLDEQGIGKKGIGLHGFTGDDPSAWLGKDASNGCVRMLQDDIDRVFHLALVGTPLRFLP